MAKGNRFPSDANKKKAAAAEKPAEAVQGLKQDLVKVEYKEEKHHVLTGVHAIRQGVNHLPEHIWAAAKRHPSVQKLIEDGHIVQSKEALAAGDVQEEAEEVDSEEQKDAPAAE